MRLSTDLITRFQAKYFEAFSVSLSLEDAEAELLGLAELIKITAPRHQITQDDLKDGELYGNHATQRSTT